MTKNKGRFLRGYQPQAAVRIGNTEVVEVPLPQGHLAQTVP